MTDPTGNADYVHGDGDGTVASATVTGHEDDSPQAVTYIESLLEGANPDEGFYE